MNPDTAQWKSIGKTDNADFFEIAPNILGVLPFEGSTDSETTARQSVKLQLEYLRPLGMRAGIVVFMDPILEQDAGARRIYRDLPDPAFQICYALVGGTGFGRAVGSVFLGLSRPRVPTKMFSTLEEALKWIREQLKKK